MKIVQTNKAYFPKVGGIETMVTTLSEGLIKDYDVDVEVLTCNHKYHPITIEKNINNVPVKFVSTFGFFSSLPISPFYFYQIPNYSGDILHIHEPFPLADISLILNSSIKKNFKKIVVSWHSDIVRQKWVLSIYKKYLLQFLDMIDVIVVSNPSLIENSDFLSHYSEKCKVIPIGVNLDWVYKKDEKPIHLEEKNENTFQILSVGRLVYYKGFEYLIEAMQYLKNAKLTIVGSGNLEKELLQRINKLKLADKIKILPELDRCSLNYLFKNCNLFILPSVEKSETYGIVQIEAMACGKPVICTEIGTGTSFINQNNFTGLVVPPRDSIALANAINQILGNSEMQNKFGSNARNRAFTEFISEKMVKSYFNLYNKLLK